MKTKWKYLKEGDVIEIVAPAGGKIESLESAKKCIEQLGFKSYISEDLVQIGADPFSANTKEYRYNDFKRALYSKDSKAIWWLQGGYGSMKILPQLILDQKPEYIKPVIDFSDATFVLCFLHTIWGIPSIHGTMLIFHGKEDKIPNENFLQIKEIILGRKEKVKYEIFPINNKAKTNSNNIENILIGGNIMLMSNTMGTKWQIDTEKKIIFLEEVGERGYKLDRILTHLIQTGFFEKASCVILGNIVGMADQDNIDRTDKAINTFADEIEIPLYKVENIGHGSKINNPLPIGTAAKIYQKSDKIYLKVESGGELVENINHSEIKNLSPSSMIAKIYQKDNNNRTY